MSGGATADRRPIWQTGGTKARRSKACWCSSSSVTVTDVAPAPGAGDVAPTNEFVVDGGVRVNDSSSRSRPSPFPALRRELR